VLRDSHLTRVTDDVGARTTSWLSERATFEFAADSGRSGDLEYDKPIAVIDTNVVMDIFGCFHVVRHYDDPGITAEHPKSVYRRDRARQALLLAQHLHNIKATTFNIYEPMTIVVREVDPEVSDTFEHHYTRIFANYVKGHVIPDWVMLQPAQQGEEGKGDKADSALVQYAKDYDVPLISFEGFTPSGIDPGNKMRRKALGAGVRVLTPSDFYGDADEQLLAALFYNGFRNGAKRYIDEGPAPAINRVAVNDVNRYFQHVLFGITEGYAEPLPVSIKSGQVEP
jgi:hypothetical protein